jgi:soluble lytic murein transglycosylase
MHARLRGIGRWAIVGVVGLLAILTLMFLRGPASWQRMYYPLQYREFIEASATRHKVNPYLVAAIINAESSWQTDVKSAQGAVGLMQVLPSTAEQLARWKKVDGERYPPANLGDPEVNIEYGTAYFRYLVERYHEIETALAAYNAGLANADEWVKAGRNIRDTIGFPETRHYVLRVVRGRDRYAALYPDAFPDWRN